MQQAFQYIIANDGIDSETEYTYQGNSDGPCWSAAERRVVATMGNFTSITPGDEVALALAVAGGPVSVAIEADQP